MRGLHGGRTLQGDPPAVPTSLMNGHLSLPKPFTSSRGTCTLPRDTGKQCHDNIFLQRRRFSK